MEPETPPDLPKRFDWKWKNKYAILLPSSLPKLQPLKKKKKLVEVTLTTDVPPSCQPLQQRPFASSANDSSHIKWYIEDITKYFP